MTGRFQLKEKKVQEVLNRARLSHEEYLIKQTEESIKRKAEYKEALLDQMMYRENTKRCLYEQFLRDKKMIDDIIQQIHEEDERYDHISNLSIYSYTLLELYKTSGAKYKKPKRKWWRLVPPKTPGKKRNDSN